VAHTTNPQKYVSGSHTGTLGGATRSAVCRLGRDAQNGSKTSNLSQLQHTKTEKPTNNKIQIYYPLHDTNSRFRAVIRGFLAATLLVFNSHLSSPLQKHSHFPPRRQQQQATTNKKKKKKKTQNAALFSFKKKHNNNNKKHP